MPDQSTSDTPDPRAAGVLAVYRHMNEAQVAKALAILDGAEPLYEALSKNLPPETAGQAIANVAQQVVNLVGAVR